MTTEPEARELLRVKDLEQMVLETRAERNAVEAQVTALQARLASLEGAARETLRVLDSFGRDAKLGELSL